MYLPNLILVEPRIIESRGWIFVFNLEGMDEMLVQVEYCGVCGQLSKFTIADNSRLLREAVCDNCGASVRNSDVAREVASAVRGFRGGKVLLTRLGSSLAENCSEMAAFHILEAAAYGPINAHLRNLPHYVSFEYLDGVRPGSFCGEIRCEDLQELTFEDELFDLVISQDVIEHIAYPDKCFREINRVLKPGGKHIFSVPYHPLIKTQDRRSRKKVYHGDPNRKEGALVYTDWGNDITMIIDRFGMQTTQIECHRFHEDNEISDLDLEYEDYLRLAPLEFYRYNSVVFVSQKISNLAKIP